MTKTLRVTVFVVSTESRAAAPAPVRTFRLPALAYLAVVILVFCTVPFAVGGTGSRLGNLMLSWRILFLLIPVIAAVFIRRTATRVDSKGITVRAAFGSTTLSWPEVRGLSVEGRSVYAVLAEGGALRLPCVTVNDLAAVSAASGGHLPEIARPTPRYAPQRGSRRR
jgi:hypothetical protein